MRDNVIEELIVLANDRSPKARLELSDRIVTLCLGSNYQLNAEEKDLAGNILIRLLNEFEVQVRGQLAMRLASTDQAPKRLILALANDEIKVAAPVIAQSPLLDEQDLIAIVRNKSIEHRLHIAARPSISAGVSDALIEAHEPEVLETLVNNQTAEIALAAMEYVVEESKTRINLREKLIARTDLPQQLAQKMLGFVSAELKQQILGKFDVDPEMIDGALRKVQAAHIAANTAQGETGAKAMALIQKLHANGELNIARVIAFLREKHSALFFAGMALLARLDMNSLMHFANEADGKGVAVICKAVGADRSQFVSVYLLLQQANNGQAVAASQLNAITRLFDALSEPQAQAVLEHWRVKLRNKPDVAVNAA